jgi:hypothetical protein
MEWLNGKRRRIHTQSDQMGRAGRWRLDLANRRLQPLRHSSVVADMLHAVEALVKIWDFRQDLGF